MAVRHPFACLHPRKQGDDRKVRTWNTSVNDRLRVLSSLLGH